MLAKLENSSTINRRAIRLVRPQNEVTPSHGNHTSQARHLYYQNNPTYPTKLYSHLNTPSHHQSSASVPTTPANNRVSTLVQKLDNITASKRERPSAPVVGGLLPQQQEYQDQKLITTTSETLLQHDTETDIIVHVVDQGRGISKDFVCSKDKVMNRMRYFASYFTGKSKIEDLDISVHCDILIFEWLVRFLTEEQEPKIELAKVIQILISSEFLGIDTLVEKCLVFVSKHLEEVIKLPIEMSCLNASILERLSTKVGLAELATLSDPKDKLTSKLYQRKLMTLIDCSNDEETQLRLCTQCACTFTRATLDQAVCSQAKVFFDVHGQQIINHEEDEEFKTEKLTQFMRKQGFPWKEIYWKIWASMQAFSCVNCKTFFYGPELNYCAKHPLRPNFVGGANIGHYRCCGAEARRFHEQANLNNMGCESQSHSIALPNESIASQSLDEIKAQQNFKLLEIHQALACNPFMQSKSQRQSSRRGPKITRFYEQLSESQSDAAAQQQSLLPKEPQMEEQGHQDLQNDQAQTDKKNKLVDDLLKEELTSIEDQTEDMKFTAGITVNRLKLKTNAVLVSSSTSPQRPSIQIQKPDSNLPTKSLNEVLKKFLSKHSPVPRNQISQKQLKLHSFRSRSKRRQALQIENGNFDQNVTNNKQAQQKSNKNRNRKAITITKPQDESSVSSSSDQYSYSSEYGSSEGSDQGSDSSCVDAASESSDETDSFGYARTQIAMRSTLSEVKEHPKLVRGASIKNSYHNLALRNQNQQKRFEKLKRKEALVISDQQSMDTLEKKLKKDRISDKVMFRTASRQNKSKNQSRQQNKRRRSPSRNENQQSVRQLKNIQENSYISAIAPTQPQMYSTQERARLQQNRNLTISQEQKLSPYRAKRSSAATMTYNISLAQPVPGQSQNVSLHRSTSKVEIPDPENNRNSVANLKFSRPKLAEINRLKLSHQVLPLISPGQSKQSLLTGGPSTQSTQFQQIAIPIIPASGGPITIKQRMQIHSIQRPAANSQMSKDIMYRSGPKTGTNKSTQARKLKNSNSAAMLP